MADPLQNEIQFLPGVGPKRSTLLQNELNIRTFEDLLSHYPYKYLDRTKFYRINEINSQMPHIQIKGRIVSKELIGAKYKKRLVAVFEDETGSIELIWFQAISWVKDYLKPGLDYVAFGRPVLHGRQISLVHPELEEADKFEKQLVTGLQAQYGTTEKLKKQHITSRTIQKLITTLYQTYKPVFRETLPKTIINKLGLSGRNESVYQLHFPGDQKSLEKSIYRLKFEELFYIQLNILKNKIYREQKSQGFVFSTVGDHLHTFYEKNLKFELTEAQKRVIREIRKDMGSGKQMNRLLQGDVGSGKTLVALMCMLIALDNGFQACIMAPTEILAIQHQNTLRTLLSGMDIEIRLLTGATKKSNRTEIHTGLMDGSVKLLVGTHAIIEESVQFKNLGLVIIDEQHRFGVAQRAKLWKKNNRPPHVLVMTATPIPRTLAMTLYGDLDVSVIDELPPGRKAIKTVHFNDGKRLRVHGFMRKQIAEGRQIYNVFPLISESEKMDYKDLEDGYFSIKQAFPSPEYAVSMVHGRLKSAEKEFEMQRFVKGETQIMISTTVIEVGVDVPNASVMIIESAERFGLSQLHQLRGRVGRGAEQSWCILMTSRQLGDEARKRIDTMVRTNDGFEIAEADLLLRGPGDIEGTQQSGIPFELKIASLAKDAILLQYTRDIALEVLENDPLLKNPDNDILVKQLRQMSEGSFNWGAIS